MSLFTVLDPYIIPDLNKLVLSYVKEFEQIEQTIENKTKLHHELTGDQYCCETCNKPQMELFGNRKSGDRLVHYKCWTCSDYPINYHKITNIIPWISGGYIKSTGIRHGNIEIRRLKYIKIDRSNYTEIIAITHRLKLKDSSTQVNT